MPKAKKAVLTLILSVSCLLIFPLCNLSADEAQIELYTGWNLIGLPLNPTIAYTAESLGDEINLQGGSCERIQYWDGAEWLTHIIDEPFGDYDIEIGRGYFVKCNSRSTLTIQGNPVTTLTLNLHPAWNSTSIPVAPIGAETAGNQINTEGGSCNTIIYWTGGGWEGHIIGMPFGDFTLTPGNGYFILSDATSTWITGPFAPQGVTATPGDTLVTLQWLENAEPDLAGYNVHQSTTPSGPYTKVNTSLIIETSYTDIGLQNEITYYYVITAEDTYSNESDSSTEVFATPEYGPTVLNITYPIEYRVLNTSSITVIGTILGYPYVTVIVNGVTATIVDNTFNADITLAEGENTITAIAYDGETQVYEEIIQVVYKPSSTYEDKAYEHIYEEMDKYFRQTIDFELELQDTTTSHRVNISDYHVISDNMEEVQIPLSAFQTLGIDLTSLKAIAFIFSEYPSGTVHFDDIKLINTVTLDELYIDDFEDGLPNNNLLSFWTSDGGSCALSIDTGGEHYIVWDDLDDYWYTVIGSIEAPLDSTPYTHISFRLRKPAWTTLRLIESYVSTDTFESGFAARVYDTALAVTALLARGTQEDIERAKILSDAFVYCQENDPTFTDGRIRDEYWATSIHGIDNNFASVKEPGSGCGNLAWVIIALLQTYEFNQSNTYLLDSALNLANFIHTEYYDPARPGYMMGYIGWEPNQFKITNKSTENNATLYAAFLELYKITGDINWRVRAESIYSYLQEKVWNDIDEFFWPGGNISPDRTNPSLDPNTLSLLALGKLTLYREALTWTEANCGLTADGFTGFDFNTDRDGIWFKGTSQMSLTYKTYNRDPDSDTYLGELRNAQSTATNNNGKGIVAASHDGVTTGFEDKLYYAALHIGTTSWFLGIERDTNLLWGQATNYNVPRVKSTIRGKVTLESRINHTNQVTFYLTNPGESTPLTTYAPPNDEDTYEPGIQITTGSEGNYELMDLPTGTFDLYAKPIGFLRLGHPNLEIPEGSSLEGIDFIDALGGDCNNDNAIDTKDLSIVNSALGSSPGDPNWDERADINGDGTVNNLDLDILNNNLGQIGLLGQDIVGAIINITYPEQDAIALGSPITINVEGTVDQSDVTVSVNGIPAQLTDGIFAATVTLTDPEDTIQAEAIDTELNVTEDSVSILYSDEKPTFVLDDFEDDVREISDYEWWYSSHNATYLGRYKDDTRAKDGKYSLGIVYHKWPGYEESYFEAYPATGSSYIDFSEHSQLRFWVYTDEPELTIRIELLDTSGASLELPDFISTQPGQWQEAVYDFSDTDMIDFRFVNIIRFYVNPGDGSTNGIFNIDGIKLVETEKEYLPIVPAAPVLTGPTGEHIYDSYQMGWTNVPSSGGRLYELWEDTDPNFTSPFKYLRSNGSLTLDGMVASGSYYYKVRAWTHLSEEGGVAGNWSNTYEVVVANEPPEIEEVNSFVANGDNDNIYERGLLVNINVVEAYEAPDITGGTVRITSASTTYDSGILQLSQSLDGTYWTYDWDTIGLEPAADYIVQTTLEDSSGQIDSDGSPPDPDLTIELTEATAPLLSKLVEDTDLSYPARGMDVKIIRRYDYSFQDEEPFGMGWTHSYVIRLHEFPGGRVDYVIGNGKETSFTPVGDGTYTNRPGIHDELIKNPDGTYILRKKDGTIYNFATDGKLTSIVDTNNNTMTFSYNADGNLETIRDPSSGGTTFTYNTWSVMGQGTYTRLVSVTDPAGRTVHYSYNDGGLLASIEDALHNFTYYSYASVNVGGQWIKRLSQIDYPEGGHKYFTYYSGDYGRLESEYRDNDNEKRTYIYSPTEPKLTIRDYYNRETIVYFNEYGKTTSVTDAYLKTTYYTWDDDLNRTSVTGPEGNTTNFTYDYKGNPLTVTKTKGGIPYTTTYTYDPVFNKVTTITDAKGRLTTEFAYDPTNGNLLTISNKIPTGPDYVTTFEYDSYGQLMTKTDARGNITRYTYYTNGLLHEEKRELDPLTVYTTTHTYDEHGNPLTVTDAEGNTTIYTYSALNKLLQTQDANLDSTSYTYDTNGNLKTITDANNNVTTYNYDLLDRLVNVTYQDTTQINYTYDMMSNLAAKRDQNGDTTTYTYDNVYRLQTKAYQDGSNVIYSYYDDGTLKDVTDANGTIHYDYNEWNELTQVTYPGNIIISYTYDELGNRTSITYPSGKVISYDYDIMNRMETATLEGATPKTATYTWNEVSQRDYLELPNGTTVDYTYDTLNRLESLTNSTSTGADIVSFTYTHDKVDNRTTMTDFEGVHSYIYDPTYQMTDVDYPVTPDQHYDYDSNSNRTTFTEGVDVTTYTTNNMNQYITVGTTTYAYNNNGCLISKTDATGTTIYEYDYENRLKGITYPDPDLTTSEYTYDYLGRRIQVNNNGTVTKYIHDGNRVIAETDDLNNVIQEYVYGNDIDEVLFMVTDTNTYYYHYDGLGSVRGITDDSENVIETYAYDVYGTPTMYDSTGIEIPSSQVSNPYYFTGRRFDTSSGLYYYRNRYYHPILGRFINQDPLGQTTGPNLYTYVGNNPINWVDPLGLTFGWRGWTGTILGLYGAATLNPWAIGAGAALIGWEQLESIKNAPKAAEGIKKKILDPYIEKWEDPFGDKTNQKK